MYHCDDVMIDLEFNNSNFAECLRHGILHDIQSVYSECNTT